MGLSTQYDSFYHSALMKETFSDVELSSWPLNRMEAILFAANQGGAVLDVGCGNGQLLYQLRNHYKRLVGLEFSPHRLEQAKINLSDLPFETVCGSAEDMNAIGSSSIDCIVSADTIEHVPDVYAATAEMYRVLKPGGRLVLNTPNIAFLKKRFLLLFGRFPSTSQPNEGLGSDVMFDGGHLHYFTFRSLSILLERAKFIVEQKTGFGRFGRIHNIYPSLLSGGVQIVATKPVT